MKAAEIVDGVLASMAYQYEAGRRYDALAGVVLKHWNDNDHQVPDAATALTALAEVWVDSEAQALADLVAAQCDAAIAYHATELEWATTELERAELHDSRDGLDGTATADNARAEDQAGTITAAQSDAADLLTAALAAGGDPARRPPPGEQRVVPPEVDAAVQAILRSI